ncbi:MAG: hypothetical protein IPH09_12405 [bacterium]|nr:hypothetical protein [bacterium]
MRRPGTQRGLRRRGQRRIPQPGPEVRRHDRGLGEQQLRTVQRAGAQRGLHRRDGGIYNSLGLKADGSVVVWGWNEYGQCNVPAPNADFVAVAAGFRHSLGLKSDGTIVAWGSNVRYEREVPQPNADYIAVAAFGSYSLALRSDDANAVVGVPDPPPGTTPGAVGFQVLSLAPNPFNPSTEITFEIVRPGDLSLEIHDAGGKLVRTERLGALDPGRHAMRWDGRDDDGLNVGSGVYFVRLRGAVAVSRAVKAVLVR